jgi:endonuclease G, mitochondrial
MEKLITLLGKVFFTLTLPLAISGQTDLDKRILQLESYQLKLQKSMDSTKQVMELVKLDYVSNKLNEIGYPTGKYEWQLVKHHAMHLAYDEKHEQPRWVMHMVLPDIIKGNVSRTNDFREDTLVTTRTAAKEDYWYSGFDRGHMAPSADFRWSPIALSESYLYSNISPQKPEFNREKWAELENVVRDYVIANKRELYVITGSILHDSLPIMKNEGRLNDVSIPQYIYKIVLDLSPKEEYAIGFIIPNGNCTYPVMSYAVSIDQLENLAGLDFFSSLPDELENKLEANTNVEPMKTRGAEGEAEPFLPTSLPKGKINTVQAKYNVGTVSCVCGTVVSTKYSEKSGSTFLNLDKKFPNTIFSVSIWEKDRTNFSYKPEEELYMRKVCVTGKVELRSGVPTMSIKNEKAIEILDLEMND